MLEVKPDMSLLSFQCTFQMECPTVVRCLSLRNSRVSSLPTYICPSS